MFRDVPDHRQTLLRNLRIASDGDPRGELVDILIVAGTIRDMAPAGRLEAPNAWPVACDGLIAIPGFINAHTHGHGSLSRGAGDRWTLELLLNAGPWISGERAIEHKYLSALINAAEMVRKGCTACYDLYFELPAPTKAGMLAVAEAYRRVGMRAVVAPMVADRSFYDAIPGLLAGAPDDVQAAASKFRMPTAGDILRTCRELIESWPFARDEIAPAVAPTIPLHCSDDLITGSVDLSRAAGVGLHMHLAESKVQAVSGPKRYGCSLTAHLNKLGFLTERTTLAHSIWIDGDDIALIAGAGASVAHNPGSNLRLGSGIAPVRAMRAAGINVGIGTDGLNCSDNQNMFEAVRLASFVSRIVSPDVEQWLTSEEVLAMAGEGSAAALGLAAPLGRIAVGYKADIVLLDEHSINFIPLNNVRNQLVNSEDGSAVQAVLIDGKPVVWAGQLINVDLRSLAVQAREAVEALDRRTAAHKAFASRLEPYIKKNCCGLAAEPLPMARTIP